MSSGPRCPRGGWQGPAVFRDLLGSKGFALSGHPTPQCGGSCPAQARPPRAGEKRPTKGALSYSHTRSMSSLHEETLQMQDARCPLFLRVLSSLSLKAPHLDHLSYFLGGADPQVANLMRICGGALEVRFQRIRPRCAHGSDAAGHLTGEGTLDSPRSSPAWTLRLVSVFLLAMVFLTFFTFSFLSL